MIEIESRELADIPVLHAYPVGQKDTPLPCVIFYHGFTSSSLVYSYFAVALAQAGLRVIMPDAPDHGSRFSGDAARRLNQFWQILLQSMQEFTTLRAAIAEENWLRDDRLAVGGASMGAMTALGITARHPTIKCTASMMGSGYFTSLARSLFPPLIPETAMAEQKMLSVVGKLVVLVDSSKIGERAGMLFSRADQIDMLITGKNANPEILQQLEAQGVSILRV